MPTGLPVSIADDPLSCVALGTGRALEEMKTLKIGVDQYVVRVLNRGIGGDHERQRCHRTEVDFSYRGKPGSARGGAVIRLAPRRAAIQRISFPLLLLLSLAAIILGKADQAVFESLRMSVTDAAAPDTRRAVAAACGRRAVARPGLGDRRRLPGKCPAQGGERAPAALAAGGSQPSLRKTPGCAAS